MPRSQTGVTPWRDEPRTREGLSARCAPSRPAGCWGARDHAGRRVPRPPRAGPLSAWIDREVDIPPRSFSESHNNESAVSVSRRLDDLGDPGSPARSPYQGAVLWGRRRTARPALLLASGFVGAVFVTEVVKRAVNRQPASGPISRISPGTFPSGHTLLALTVYGCLAVLVLRSGAPALVRWRPPASSSRYRWQLGWRGCTSSIIS